MKRNVLVILSLLTLLGLVLRITYFDWGDGYLFHPDERNIGYAISQLDFKNGQYNPQFWAYGSLPIYIIYVIAIGLTQLSGQNFMLFGEYLLIGRIISAICSTALIPLTYIITRKLIQNKKNSYMFALLAAFWVCFLPGMIQFAHFTTFETFLTLQYLVILLAAGQTAINGTWRNYLLLGTLLGLSVGTKITSLALVPLLPISHWIYQYNLRNVPVEEIETPPSHHLPSTIHHIKKYFLHPKLFLSGLLILPVAILTSPYFILDWNGFMNSLSYESGVANGSLIVFYTQQFIDTIPIIYQITQVFPYILTIPLTLVSIAALVIFSYQISKIIVQRITPRPSTIHHPPISPDITWKTLTITLVLLYLAFHLSLYVKWTRYMIPTLPFLTSLGAAWLAGITVKINAKNDNAARKKQNALAKLMIGGISIWVLFSGTNFWKIYQSVDNRVQAAEWANTNIPKGSQILSEEYDLGIIPFNPTLGTSNIQLMKIYDIEHNGYYSKTISDLNGADYFISLSQRAYSTRYRLPDKYPQGKDIYDEILYDRKKWQEVYRISNKDSIDCSPLTFYCLGGQLPPDETFTVFDHPTIRIFEHIQ